MAIFAPFLANVSTVTVLIGVVFIIQNILKS